MIVFNPVKLALSLARGELTEKQKFRYLFTYICVSLVVSLVLALGFALPSAPKGSGVTSAQSYSIIAEVIGLIMFMIGIVIAYQVNEKGDNKDFVLRYISLSVPLTIHSIFIFLMIFATLFLFVTSAVSAGMTGTARKAIMSESIGLATLASLLLSYLYFYVSIIVHMRTASSQVATGKTPGGKPSILNLPPGTQTTGF